MSRIFGVRLDHVGSEERLREFCVRALDGDRTTRIFTPNPEILLQARADPTYAETLRSADLALPDGTGVALIETLRAGRRIRRWPGVEIGELLVRLAAERDVPVAFVGGGADVAERAAARWRRRLPGIRIAVAGADTSISEDGVVLPAERDPASHELGRRDRTGGRPGRFRRAETGAVDRAARGRPPERADHDRDRRLVPHVGGRAPTRTLVPPESRPRMGVEARARAAPLAEDVPGHDRVPAARVARSGGVRREHPRGRVRDAR